MTVTHVCETTTASAIAVPRQAEAVTLFALVETSRAAHDPDDDAAKHAFPGPGSLVKIAHSQKFAIAGNYWAAGGTLAGIRHWPGWRRPMPHYYFDIFDIKEGHRLVNPSGSDFKNDGAAIARRR